MDYMENLRGSPIFRHSFNTSSPSKLFSVKNPSSPVEVNITPFPNNSMQPLHHPRSRDPTSSTLDADKFENISTGFGVSSKDKTSSSVDDVPLLDERQVTIIVLLARVCSVYDATPKTFVANVLRLHHLGILESVSFLVDLGLLNASSSVSPINSDRIEQWEAEKNIASLPQSLNVSRYARDFEEIRLLGRGGFGEVFMARNKLDGICYAIKQVRFYNKGFQSPLVQKVLREVHCLARCDHPNINRYYSAWLEPTWIPMNLHPYTAATLHNIINPMDFQVKNQKLIEDIYRFVDEKSETDNHDLLNNLNDDDVKEASKHTVPGHFFASSTDSAVEFVDDVEQSNSFSSCFSDLPIYNPNQSSFAVVETKSTDKIRLHDTQIQLAPPNLFKPTPIVKDWQLQPPWKPSFPDLGSVDLHRKNRTALLALEGDTDLAAPSPGFTYQITLYIQMYLCEQSTLQSWLDERNRKDEEINVQKSLIFLRQLVDGLLHVHQNGIIHRDLKPNNVFMTRDGCLKIGDFGLSKLLAEVLTDNASDLGSSRAVHHPSVHTQGVGTISYASPEQVSGTEYDHKVDSFRYVSKFSKSFLQICTSLGVIALELFCIFKTKMERAEALKGLRSTVCRLPKLLVQTYPDIAHLIRHLVAPTAQRWSIDTTQKYLHKKFPQVQLEKAQEVSELRQQLQENHTRLKEQDAIIEKLRRQVAALSNE